MARVSKNSLSVLERAAQKSIPAAQYQEYMGSMGMQAKEQTLGSEQFTAGMMGPGYPILPFPLDDPQRRGVTEFRLTEYLPGWNYPMVPGAGKLIPFPVLRALSRMVNPVRACINLRRHELAIQEWDIVLRPQYHDKAADPEIMKKREELLKFFSYPDTYEGNSFADWIQMASEEIDVIDALSVYLRPTLSDRGGVLHSGLGALSIIDGSTIKPLRDARGGRPQPPAPAYQQYLYGAPRADGYSILPTDFEGDVIGQYTTNQLLYKPFNKTSFDAYGFSNIEAAIQEIKLWIDREQHHQSYFDSSDVPMQYIEVPKEWSATQLEEYEQRFNRRLAGDPRWRWRVKMIPGGTGVHYVKPVQYDMTFDEWIVRQIAMAFMVAPETLGLSPKSGLGGGNWAGEAAQRQIRLSLQPRLIFFAELFNLILHRVLGVDEFVFQWINLDNDDIRDKAYADTLYVREGVRTRAEVREENGWDAIDVPGANTLLVTTRQGTVPLEQVMAYGRALDHQDGTVTDTTNQGSTQEPYLPPPPVGAADDKTQRQAKPLTAEALKSLQSQDLKKWQRLLKARGILTRAFQSDVLPQEFRDTIELLANHVPQGVPVEKWREQVFKVAQGAVKESEDVFDLFDYPFIEKMGFLGGALPPPEENFCDCQAQNCCCESTCDENKCYCADCQHCEN